ncbi:MAG: ABC transporter permease [Verrucomicrobiales bacterium]|nr:ABC transporter permease [Verrucomicrobiales bacterium]
MARLFSLFGRIFFRFCSYLGELALLIREMAVSVVRHPVRWRLAGQQIVSVGWGSQLVVIVTGAFTGAVFAAQIYMKFAQLGLSSSVGGLVSLAMTRELGPVLTAIMLTGRVGGGMAAEIGTMKVTEQVDALRSIGVHPVDYLVTPRLLGMLVSMPLLIAESVTFGIYASYVIAVGLYRIDPSFYNRQLVDYTEMGDILFGMTKGLVFGLLIVLISCHQGLKVHGGPVGVGRATNSSVVIASLFILICNFFLTMLLSYLWPISTGT